MIKIEGKHSMSEYLSLLGNSLTIYMDKSRLEAALDSVALAEQEMRWLAAMWLKIESGGKYVYLRPESLIDFLLDMGVDLDKRYCNRKTKGYSLDMKKVIEPMIADGLFVDLLQAYKAFKTNKSYHSSLSKLTTKQKIHRVTESGRIILEFPTHIEERDNLRVYYSDIAVVSVPKLYSTMITGPSDAYYVAWCDYPQADWRFAYNLFIRSSENEQTMRECSDAYEGLARLVEGEQFNLEEFRNNRKFYKEACLKVFYNSQDMSPVSVGIRKLFTSCAKYKKLLFDLQVLYKFKLPIPVTSYFGFEQLVPEGAYPDAFVSKAMNTPIQTFTSHVVNETVFSILEKFWGLGYTEQDINVYYVRHDEPLFLFTRNILKDAWIFEECSHIYIPGFTPITLDFHFGRYYQEEDAVLTEEIRRAIKTADFNYTTFCDEDFQDEIRTDYNPVPTVEHVHVNLEKLTEEQSGYVAHLFNFRNESRADFNVSAQDRGEAINELFNGEALKWLGSPAYLLVYTQEVSFINYVGLGDSTLMKVEDKFNPNIG